jgi:hypothetical protein
LQHVSSQTGVPDKTTSQNEAETKAEEPSLLADLAALITEIEGAPAGSAALDARIHFGFRVATQGSPDISALLIEQGITWPTVEAVLDEQIPPFTTSLDAALEGEDITFVIRSTKRGRWGAMQKARCGEEILAWAATEPLARRLSALRACYVDMEKTAAVANVANETPPATLPTPEIQADAPAGEKDWEVLF